MITKVLTSVSFLYHHLPTPPEFSVSQEPDVAVSVPRSSLTPAQSSVSRQLTVKMFAFLKNMAAPICVKVKLTGMTRDKEDKADGLSTFVPQIIKQ